ncbi:MAG: hypothetical protein Q4G33_01725 [bacterium]|nr:hypothetical protein [bacterium]
MPRKAREKSKTGIYAVLIKGNDASRKLFYDDEDYSEFIARLDENLDTAVMAFALCESCICMIAAESERGIGLDIQPVTIGYARYYGNRYGMSGGIFERRFRSMPIETPEALAAQLACVHRFCDTAGNGGYTGRYMDDDLFIPDEAMKLLGSRDIYDEAMKAENPVTAFFAGSFRTASGSAEKKTAANKIKEEPKKAAAPEPEVKAEPEKAPEAEPELKPEPKPKKKKKMPSWLL